MVLFCLMAYGTWRMSPSKFLLEKLCFAAIKETLIETYIKYLAEAV